MLYMFMASLYAISTEWTDISNITEIVTNEFNYDGYEYEFLETRLMNDYWVELNCESKDIVGGVVISVEDDAIQILNGKRHLQQFFSIGKNGLYKYLNAFGCFNAYFEHEQDDITEALENCRLAFVDFYVPETIQTVILELVKEKFEGRSDLEKYCKEMSMNNKVCAFFNLNNDEDYECQARFFLERNDGKYLVTNMLKFKKEQDFIFREGFGEKIEHEFAELQSKNKKHEKLQTSIRTEIITLATLLGFACLCICALVYYNFVHKLNE